jgi:hypothetical protein
MKTNLEREREQAPRLVKTAADRIPERAPALQVFEEILEGSPKEMIVEEAERWGADIILVGSHGFAPLRRFLLVVHFIITAAFGRRCIPPRGGAHRSNTPGILPPRALRGGRLGALGASP